MLSKELKSGCIPFLWVATPSKYFLTKAMVKERNRDVPIGRGDVNQSCQTKGCGLPTIKGHVMIPGGKTSSFHHHNGPSSFAPVNIANMKQGWRQGRAKGLLPSSEYAAPLRKLKSDFSESFGIYSTLKTMF